MASTGITLLWLRGFPHDPQGILTVINGLTLVSVELFLNVAISVFKAVGRKLCIAAFAYA